MFWKSRVHEGQRHVHKVRTNNDGINTTLLVKKKKKMNEKRIKQKNNSI